MAQSEQKEAHPVTHAEDLHSGEAHSKDTVHDAATRGQALTGYETLTPWETAKKFKACAFYVFLAALSAGTDGYQTGLNAGILANSGFVKQFATEINSKGKPVLASNVLAAWGSVLPVGQFVANVLLPFVSARLGRKAAMLVCWAILAASIVGESLAREWPHWLVAKFLAGLGLGCMQATIPMYITETAPTRIRGMALMSYNLWWTAGTFFAYVAMEALSVSHTEDWLIPVYTQWAHIGLMAIIYLILPESPAWAVARGKHDRARKALTQLYKGVEDFDLEHQMQVLVMLSEHEAEVAAMQSREKWYAIFQGTDGFRTIVAFWTLVSQQFTGLVLFSTFGAYFFQQAGVGDPFQIKCITLSVKIVAAVAVVYFADSVGRRMISCSGTTTMWAMSLLVGILGVVPRVPAVNYVFVLFAVIWNIGLTMNGATGWGFVGEISSQRLRHYTSGAAAACNAIFNIGMNQLVPHMVNENEWNWGLKAGWFYAGVGLPFVIAIWLLIPETSGRSHAELDELFERKIKPWRFHKTETATQRVVESQRD
ncbi:unnamed protein product [Clonostachys chloroleuca]|uniref:Major facilitator superfamily (MFS) profile domain-containing protein n=1 Tax=Clonostachys chloroleuca TaxID=1926264 RepID=A0AA35LTX6_9HYPO|nr:unnamed protein product [Clonostachys chloroleuca]